MASGGWARRWREGLAPRSRYHDRRVAAGRGYQRSGRVSDLRVRAGRLSGRVQGTKATPFLVEVEVPVLDDGSWDAVVAALAGKVRHHARLLAGQTPEGLDEELRALGIELLPARGDLVTSCRCADPEPVCDHVTAVWEAAAERLETDPFMLLHLRGRGRERLLSALADARRSASEPAEPLAGVAIAGLDTAGWYQARGKLDDVSIPPITRRASPAGPLRLLGDPPGWEGSVGSWELLRGLISDAATWAESQARQTG